MFSALKLKRKTIYKKLIVFSLPKVYKIFAFNSMFLIK